MGDTSKRSVRWDEDKLSEIEANKPVRQKITEPKTPFHRMTDVDGSLSPVRDADSVPSAFNDIISSNSNNNSHPSGWTSSEEDADAMDEDDEGRTSSFKEQRRAHYDEFHKVRELRRTGSSVDGSSNDDDDEGEEKKSNGERDTPSSLAVGVKDIDITDAEGVAEPPKHSSS
ncbi:hypothetical protein OSB04_026161 [Centaurea solstitialis]|uniref:Protein phosphatase inhibitor 2 n=1 Tax=Centaurea solstitialis TaxID=347529 RepID=A0AA38SBE4_9ASTR|nr:hypothetical protein OSB04_026161 [Centaurea solstitialis]